MAVGRRVPSVLNAWEILRAMPELSPNRQIALRAAERGDAALIFSMIVELAEYERAPEQVTGSEQLLGGALFGPGPCAEAVIAERGRAPAGFALYYRTFSTWETRPGIWLEDLYVRPEHRRAGIGEALLSQVARTALDRGCARLEWAALDWNAPALRFYDKLGATRRAQWQMLRLDGPALASVAAREP